MSEMTKLKTWQEELASPVEDTGIQYPGDEFDAAASAGVGLNVADYFVGGGGDEVETESVKDQVKGFLMASAEMLRELAKGCRDVVQQSLGNEDSYIVRKLGRPWAKVSGRLRFLNEFLPEDRDPVHAWPVVFFVFILALSVLSVNTKPRTKSMPKKVYIHPPSAAHIQLSDGRLIAYHEQGVPADRARFSLISPHSFLSSRLAGIPGVKESLLNEFGIRLVTYDLPGFGESDPHPKRNLNSSAQDMSQIADAVGVNGKFWVLGYSGGGMHAWAAMRYIPDRLAGAAMVAPIVNPYDPSMTKEERYRIWEKWTLRRKLMYVLARRFPRLLTYFYRRSFLSGHHGQLDKWLSFKLEKKDRTLVEEPIFEEFWQRDVEESIRQGNPKPFIEEAALQVSSWGFSLADIQLHRKRLGKGFLAWIKSTYSQPDRELEGFLGPIHIWQGMDDQVVAPSTAEFVRRLVRGATVHKLPNEGHFSYFCFCDECHKHIFSTLFGTPQSPLNGTLEVDQDSVEEGDLEEEVSLTDSTTSYMD